MLAKSLEILLSRKPGPFSIETAVFDLNAEKFA
jgi:hypothetical protein